MSIDYRAEYGIGYEVIESDDLLEDENEDLLEDGLNEYIEMEAEVGFTSFETNQGYDTECDAVYLIVDNPLGKGLNLEQVKKELDEEVKRLRLEVVGDFGLVGGMYVY